MMELTKKIYRNSLIAMVPVMFLSALIEWKKLPLSIMAGAILCLINFRGLAWGARGILGSSMTKGPLIFFSFFRLALLLIVIVILLKLGYVNLIGLFAGFTVVFTVVLIEGMKAAKDL